ncbi:MAG: tRNA (cytidine(34)-2'-O)-methyltransferase [Verrucomicrobiota bacterium]|nr:tRNA (cytidine(34)-2'-O)-methyltransferase [Verrucomicrobiota bacterium]
MPLNVVLVHPEIPPNTGNIARLCAATGSHLHLVEPLGFSIDDAKLRRAGLDYWEDVHVQVHPSWNACLSHVHPRRLFFYSTASGRRYDHVDYEPGDTLVFGCETKGLPDDLLAAHPGQILGIPMRTEFVRSLNLSTAVGIVVYHALHTIDQRLSF